MGIITIELDESTLYDIEGYRHALVGGELRTALDAVCAAHLAARANREACRRAGTPVDVPDERTFDSRDRASDHHDDGAPSAPVHFHGGLPCTNEHYC